MDVDVKPELPNLDSSFVDDDELQAVLAQSRRRKVRKTKKVTVEDIVEQGALHLLYHRQINFTYVFLLVTADRAAEDESVDVPTGGLTFDDTSEFVRAITYTPAAVKTESVEPIIVRIDTSALSRDAHLQNNIDNSGNGDEALTELEAGSPVKDEEMEDEETAMMLMAIEEAMGTENGQAAVNADEV